jgi:hypothetical protein
MDFPPFLRSFQPIDYQNKNGHTHRLELPADSHEFPPFGTAVVPRKQKIQVHLAQILRGHN